MQMELPNSVLNGILHIVTPPIDYTYPTASNILLFVAFVLLAALFCCIFRVFLWTDLSQSEQRYLSFKFGCRAVSMIYAALMAYMSFKCVIAQLVHRKRIIYDLPREEELYRPFADWAIPISIAYYLFDTSVIITKIFLFGESLNSSMIYIIHHIITAGDIYFLYQTGRGSQIVAVAFCLTELPNMFLKLRQFAEVFGEPIFLTLSTYLLTFVYIGSALILSPIGTFSILKYVIFDEAKNLPKFVKLSTALTGLTILLGRMYWSTKLLKKFQKFRKMKYKHE